MAKIRLPKIKLPKVKLNLFNDGKEVASFAEKAILEAEEHFVGDGRGKEKLDAVVEAINAAVDIPWVPEAIEAFVFRALAELAVGFTRGKLDDLREKHEGGKRRRRD